MRGKTPRKSGESLRCVIQKLNQTLRGWFAYFQHNTDPTKFERLDGWIRMRLRSILRKRHKGRGQGRGLDHRRWPNQHFADYGLFSLVAAHASACQSSRR